MDKLRLYILDDDEQYTSLLAEMGCDIAQGYLLSRPIPADELFEWVKNKT